MRHRQEVVRLVQVHANSAVFLRIGDFWEVVIRARVYAHFVHEKMVFLADKAVVVSTITSLAVNWAFAMVAIIVDEADSFRFNAMSQSASSSDVAFMAGNSAFGALLIASTVIPMPMHVAAALRANTIVAVDASVFVFFAIVSKDSGDEQGHESNGDHRQTERTSNFLFI